MDIVTDVADHFFLQIRLNVI